MSDFYKTKLRLYSNILLGKILLGEKQNMKILVWVFLLSINGLSISAQEKKATIADVSGFRAVGS
jgi:hypothetical protein